MIRFVLKGGYGQVLNTRAVLLQQLSYKRNIKGGCPHRRKGVGCVVHEFLGYLSKGF